MFKPKSLLLIRLAMIAEKDLIKLAEIFESELALFPKLSLSKYFVT